jgi:trimeric autotransporter adhesin
MADKSFFIRALNVNNAATANTIGFFIGTSVANTLGFHVGANVSILNNSVKVGNSTVFTTTNATNFSGIANNSLSLGGTLASGYQTTTGLAANVATMTALNANNLGGNPAANYVLGTTLSSTLSNYATSSALSSGLTGKQNSLGYTPLNKAGDTMIGALGFGLSSLQTSGDINATRAGNTTGVIYFGNTGSRYLYYDGSAYQMPGASLTVGGDITASSDKKLKENVLTIKSDDALADILAMRGCTYTRNDLDNKEQIHIGCIAQEVQKIRPELVVSIEDTLRLNYSGIVPLLIQSIHKIQEQIDELKNK